MVTDPNTLELQQLRLMREIHLSIQELESQLQGVSKRYRTGIRLLRKELHNLEFKEPEDFLPGLEETFGISDVISKLIANPVLSNVPSDDQV